MLLTLKQAAEHTGLSAWELRTGAIAGKYPHIRTGTGKGGKYLFNPEQLEQVLQNLAQENQQRREEELSECRPHKNYV